MLSRRFGAQSLVRLLGHWQESTARLSGVSLQRRCACSFSMAAWRWKRDCRERELAAALNISRTTVASALGQLREEGYLYSRQGAVRGSPCRASGRGGGQTNGPAIGESGRCRP